ncbi:MAG: response regulator transcription factor [Solirubrobacterales bacterium]|jgi:two-component system response regulator DegU|nr:response regulator transcription factor [Solirubrobacterales bacterium]
MSDRRVLICDDHWIVRQAIRQRIDEIPGFEVVGEVEDGAEVVAAVREHRPDLVLIDVEMPGVNGIEATSRVMSRWPELRVLVFTAHGEDDLVRLAYREGAAGFLMKSAEIDQIREACETVVGGETWFPGYEGRLEDEDELQRLRALSEREREILGLLATGMRAQGVAEEIGIQPATVYTHVRNVVAKLGVDTRTQAVAIATRYAFLEPAAGSSGATSRRTPARSR